MDAVNPLFALLVILLALLTCYLLAKKYGVPIAHERFQSIDGLRGYLALFVFIHHSSIWYYYLRSGEWKVPPSVLFTDFGIVGVALFFMITGFLFFSKLLKGRSEKIDWERLFVSRILRLIPLYLLIVVGIVVISFVSSHGAIVGSRRNLLSGIWQWIILGTPDLNGMPRTSLAVASVTWSLRYEWFFYLSLPLIALFVGVIAPWPYLALSCAGLYFLPQWWELKDYHEMFFLGGVVASLLVRSSSFCRISRTKIASIVIVVCLFSIVLFCPPAY